MGREWLVRKGYDFSHCPNFIGNTEYSLKIINNIEKKHSDMLNTEQYRMVSPFISLFKNYIKNPHEVNQEKLSDFEEKIN